MSLAEVSTAIATALGIISLVGGFLAYVKAATRKEYAAQRDMQHFKNNQLQLRQSILEFARGTEQETVSIREELIRINGKIDYLINQNKGK
jgi:hypothetical protein